MSEEPHFADVVNPTHEEIRVWAYSGALAPMEDWDIIIAEIENLDLLVELVGDPSCPGRQLLLSSLYCLAGHSDRLDPRLQTAAENARAAADPWIATWGRRVCHVNEHPADFNRSDWCGGNGYYLTPEG